jgi:hypothetical protein
MPLFFFAIIYIYGQERNVLEGYHSYHAIIEATESEKWIIDQNFTGLGKKIV